MSGYGKKKTKTVRYKLFGFNGNMPDWNYKNGLWESKLRLALSNLIANLCVSLIIKFVSSSSALRTQKPIDIISKYRYLYII